VQYLVDGRAGGVGRAQDGETMLWLKFIQLGFTAGGGGVVDARQVLQGHQAVPQGTAEA
jgi:hypothetical protein